MTKLTETTTFDCSALAEAILPNGQTLFCQFDDYDDLKNFQIESGGKPCLVQYDRDNNVKLIEHDYTQESLDWRKEWTGYVLHEERPWHLLKDLYDNSMMYNMDMLYKSLLSSFDWDREEKRVLIKMDLSERDFNLTTITYPVVNQTISQGLNESMGVIV
jgi:hypothetical protein